MRIAIVALGLLLVSCLKNQKKQSETAVAEVPAPASAELEPEPVFEFFRTPAGSLILQFNQATQVMTCVEPETGAFIVVSYLYQGVWMLDVSQIRVGGFDSMGDGGYFLDGSYIEYPIHPPSLGCDVISNQPVPRQVEIPYKRNFQFIGQVGRKDIGPLTSSLEEWASDNGFTICGPGVPNGSCTPRDAVEFAYYQVKQKRGDGKDIRVFQTLQGEPGTLKLRFPITLTKSIESIIKLDELPLLR